MKRTTKKTPKRPVKDVAIEAAGHLEDALLADTTMRATRTKALASMKAFLKAFEAKIKPVLDAFSERISKLEPHNDSLIKAPATPFILRLATFGESPVWISSTGSGVFQRGSDGATITSDEAAELLCNWKLIMTPKLLVEAFTNDLAALSTDTQSREETYLEIIEEADSLRAKLS